MRKLRPVRAEIKKFLDSAIIDPNKRGEFIHNQLVEQGDPSYYEVRVVEYAGEARRIRERIKTTSGKGRATLVELYRETMRKAATALAISVGKIDEKYGPELIKKVRKPKEEQQP